MLAGCAIRPAISPVAAASCETASVPAGAVFGVRHGTDIATYPPASPRTGTGCQRVWYGDRAHPERMQVLATYYYESGHVRRLVGQVPGGATYDCHYRDGVLDREQSRNPGQCPKANEIE